MAKTKTETDMSTMIETTMPRHLLATFSGGALRGVCLQITCNDQTGQQFDREGFIQLTMEDASELIGHLAQFVKDEATRRQSLLSEQITDLLDAERTIFHEIAELSPERFEVSRIAVNLVSKFCPKS